jgi:hypothetical protein
MCIYIQIIKFLKFIILIIILHRQNPVEFSLIFGITVIILRGKCYKHFDIWLSVSHAPSEIVLNASFHTSQHNRSL